ncbi:unnamed protein product [Rotaria magnacalcarata]|uniref:Uncharacterized protein n=1 Tax=Rotaria magnacalcarata TaxID=392030 RepID=A0A816PBD1_9BILA|nr:unnamed protein product [Rotaria magnacalcarata]CAF1614227.1 unnamed protein product [Rotaria magnacalcarata]CAF1914715.1 unnamed protein product [Rotaria magnacalcarata]CAF2046555.1 unnamed protein product [Rotaria magnacalcarata]CAF2056373.1 unnamed protein product [Rotaria magnacalcarata]
MYSNVSTQFASAPVPISDIGASGQQQNHYNLLNAIGTTAPSLLASAPIKIPNSNINTNGNESSSQNNESSQSKIFIDNLYKPVLLREKNTYQLYDTRKTQKRLSDSILAHQQHLSILSNIHTNLQHLQTNSNFQIDLNNNHTLTRHASLRFKKTPSTLQTIHQQSSSIVQLEPQKLFVIRHGERVDSTFGANWLDQVFDKSTGVYRRINLNLPKKMVKRKDLKDFLFDPPLTELGLHECKIIGEELAAQGIKIDHVYSSPALRCVQTADKILEGLQMRDKISIRIEPCVFEFLKWYPIVPVKWPFLDLDELNQNGYNVDRSYKPFYPIESLRKDEDELMFYTRSHYITTSILKKHENDGGNLLIVGHAPTIEVCTRQLTGGQPRINDLKFLVLRVPYLSMHCVAKQIDGTWKAAKPPILPNKHAAIEPFEWRFFR